MCPAVQGPHLLQDELDVVNMGAILRNVAAIFAGQIVGLLEDSHPRRRGHRLVLGVRLCLMHEFPWGFSRIQQDL